MKKMIFLVFFLAVKLLLVNSAFAQETGERTEEAGPLSFGIGLEWNMSSRHNFSGGLPVNLIYNLYRDFALGLNATGSSNFFSMKVIELSILARSYLQKNDHTGPFIQGELGTFIIYEDEGETYMALAGARLGYRHPIARFLYIEPYGRLGYPFAFGVGIMAGILF